MQQLPADTLRGRDGPMRALGYFRTEDGPDRRGELEQAFLDYCHIHLHQPVKTFGDTALAEDGPLPEYDRLVRYMGESRGSFLVVVPDAEHLGGDLESVVRRLVELESAGAKVICEDDDHPDPLQGALRSLGVKGVSRERSRLIRECPCTPERSTGGASEGHPMAIAASARPARWRSFRRRRGSFNWSTASTR